MPSKSKIDIKRVMEETSQYVMGTYNRASIALASGSGSNVVDVDGKEYLDFTTGIAVNIFGYGNKRLINTAKKTAATGLWHSSNLYHIANQAKAAKILSKQCLKGKSFFCNSGTEANEAALKLAFKYASTISSEKTEIVSLTNSFHGRTLGSLSVTGQEKYRKNFPAPTTVKFVDINDVEGLKKAVNKNTAALIVEIIQGESGIHVMTEDFYKACRKVTKKHKAVFIVDEVQTGLGRTGECFAFRHYTGMPDVVTIAKGIAGGLPMGIMHASKQFSDILEPGDHASTFGGNHIASALAIDVLKVITKKLFLSDVRERSAYLKKNLESLKNVKAVRGLGFMLAIDTSKKANDVTSACRESGLLVLPTGENTIRLLPSLMVTKEDIDKALSILAKHI